MIVLDASVVIAYFDAGDASHGRAERLLIDRAGESLVLSALTRAEVLVRPMATGDAARFVQALRHLVSSTTALSAEDADEVARIRAQTGLRLPDCCVLRAAEFHGARLATFDERLARVAWERGVEVLL